MWRLCSSLDVSVEKLWECDWPAEIGQHFLTWFNAYTSGQCRAGMLPALAVAKVDSSALVLMYTCCVANTQLPCVGWCVCVCIMCGD